MRTLVKFEVEPHKQALISKTLGKIAFLSREHQNRDRIVRPDEHWIVEIVNETLRERGGSFWVNPIRKLDDKPIPLIAGAFRIDYIEDVALVIPNQQSDRWVFPGYLRDVSIMRYVSSVIVDIDQVGSLDFVRRKLPSTENIYRFKGNGVYHHG